MSLGDELRGKVESSKVEWKRRPEVLLHPNVPKPLHGLAPRVVLGQDWWDTVRRQAYRSTNYHCIACGVHRSMAVVSLHLEGHEVYSIDYLLGRATYVETVPLCHYCHSYIHSGRLRALVNTGKVALSKLRAVTAHGDNIIREAGLKHLEDYSGPTADWADWRLVVNGKEYEPLYKSYEEWCNAFTSADEE